MLEQRYFSFGDFRTRETDEIYNKIYEFLKWYEQSDLPIRSNVHGDPVFTNVIVDKNNRIRLIDMRGIQGETLTLTGDRNYDFSKVYQSLVGYDFIIRKLAPEDNKLKNFRNLIVEASGLSEKHLSMLAASLLFTCIPLQPDTVKKDILNLAKLCLSTS